MAIAYIDSYRNTYFQRTLRYIPCVNSYHIVDPYILAEFKYFTLIVQPLLQQHTVILEYFNIKE